VLTLPALVEDDPDGFEDGDGDGAGGGDLGRER
jgi:hypothetical protein